MSLIDHAPTRRAFAGLLAATSATGSLCISALASDAHSLDAALFEMVASLGLAKERLYKFNELTDLAMEDYVSPDIPAELRFRSADYPHVCCDPQSNCAGYDLGDGRLHLVYEDEKALTSWAQDYWTTGEAYSNKHFSAADRTRTQEIKAAYDRWQIDIRGAEDAAGITEPFQLGNRETDLIVDLLRQIAMTPARTPEGVLAKGHASMLANISNGVDALEGRLSSLLAKSSLSWSERPEIVSLSLMIDAARLRSPECQSPRTQAAA